MDLIKKYLQEQNSDTGWKQSQTNRKDKFGNPVKTANVAKNLARKAMKSAIADLKKGPEAGKRQVEEVEDLEELKKDTLNKYITRTRFSSDPKRRMGAQKAMAKVGQKPKEEKPVTEAKDHSQLAAMHSAKAEEHGKMAASYHSDTDSSDLADRHMELSRAHSDAARLHTQAAKSNNPADSEKAHEASADAKYLAKQYNESVGLNELKRSTIRSYGNKRIRDLEGDKSVEYPFRPKSKSFSNPKRDVISTGLVRASARLSGVKPTQKEEAELDEELTNSQKDAHFTLMNKHRLAAKSAKGAEKDKHLMAAYDHQHALQNPWYAKSHNDAMAASKKLGVSESAELDEAETSKLYNYAFDKYADITSGKNKKDKAKAPGYEKIARNAFKMGISRPMKKSNLPEEVEELDESLRNKLAAMGVAATMAASPAAARVTDGGQSFAQQTAQQTTQPQSVKAPKEIPSKSYLQNVASGKSRSMMHPDTAKELLKKHYSEEVDLVSKYFKLGEGRFPGFRSSSKTGGGWSRSVRMRGARTAQPSYDQDPRTGLPLGFSNPPKSDKPEDEKDKVKN